jgi:exonuclease VII small subunit
MSSKARASSAASKVTPLRARRPSAIRSPAGATATVEGSAIVVRDPAGAIVVTYDAETGSATIAAPRGDLELAAGGCVRIVAGDDVSIEARRTTRLSGETMLIEAGRWELAAARILERAGEVYRECDDLLQTRAGRLRTLVKGAVQLFSRSTSMASEEDTSVDGRRVLLG